MNRARAMAESTTVAAAAALVGLLRERSASWLGRRLGDLWYVVDVRHRRIARRNLAWALPELPAARRAAIARASFRHFGAVMVDLLRFPAYGPDDCRRRTRVTGWDHLERALAGGKGALVFSAHYGNWELVALNQGFRGHPMDMVTRPMDNPALERRLAASRRRSGNRVIHKRSAVRGILTSLREGRSVAIVIDQNFRDRGRVFVEFFGRPAATTPTLGVIAVRTGAPVVPVFSWPEADGRMRIEYRPPVQVETSGDRAEDALRYTRSCTRMIEEQVRARPEYWMWAHQRWRTRPEEGAPVATTAAVAGKAGG